MLNLNPYYKSSIINFKSAADGMDRKKKAASIPVFSADTYINRGKIDIPQSRESSAAGQLLVLRNVLSLIAERPNLFTNTDINLLQWVKQFETTEEQLLALKMMKNFKYIDISNARKAFKSVFEDIKKEGVTLDNTVFAVLGTSKSGSMTGYLFRQANKIRSKGPNHHKYTDTKNLTKEKFLDYTQLQDVKLNKDFADSGKKENIVIIDDMIGDGDSLLEYFTDNAAASLKNYKNVYYVTLIGDPDGIKRINKKFPELKIKFRPAEYVYKYNSEENTEFTSEEKKKIDNLVKKYSSIIDKDLADKYSRSHLLVSFAWNSPGNAPMMFNVTNNNWTGLFTRYNGIQEGEIGHNFNFKC